MRRFWKGDEGLVAEMASRVAGSSDIFGYRGRRPWASINFVTAHDGFTLQDLVSYEQKHNEANGEDNRDGHDAELHLERRRRRADRRPEIVALRDQQKRNFMATLLLSLGVPMLLAGDEFGHSAERQQQRLLPGQRDLLARLGEDPPRGRGAAQLRALS